MAAAPPPPTTGDLCLQRYLRQFGSGHGADLVASRRKIHHPLDLDGALTFLVKRSGVYRYVVVQNHIPRITPVDGPEVFVPLMVDQDHILLLSISCGEPVLTPAKTLADCLSLRRDEYAACRVFVREGSRSWVPEETVSIMTPLKRMDYIKKFLTCPWIHPEWHLPRYGDMKKYPD